MRKYRLTGCARFLIFVLIATPIAYFAASYYNNQNPIQTVQTWFSGESAEQAVEKKMAPPPSSPDSPAAVIDKDSAPDIKRESIPASHRETFREILEHKDRRIEELIRENERLRNQLEQSNNNDE